jgi:hypothetical protein
VNFSRRRSSSEASVLAFTSRSTPFSPCCSGIEIKTNQSSSVPLVNLGTQGNVIVDLLASKAAVFNSAIEIRSSELKKAEWI